MRMRQPGAGARDIPSQGLSLRGRSPPPPPAPGRDPQIAHIFRNMRAAMRVPREAIARRLATTPAVIEDLESGAVTLLPPWPETVRIVRSYCELLGLDPKPLLWRIEQILRGGPGQGARDDVPTRPAGSSPLALRKPPPREHVPRRGVGLGRLLLFAMPPVIASAVASLAIWAPGPTYKAISLLPHSLAGPARAGMDILVLYSAPRREGFRWIDVGDPKLRKVDKQRPRAR
jgi:hypothetical protein